MTDSQFGILIAAIVGVVGSLAVGFRSIVHWAVNQVVGALKSNEEALKSNSSAMMRHEVRAEQFSDRLEDTIEKIDKLSDWMEDNTPVENPEVGRYRKHKKRRPTNPTIAIDPSLLEPKKGTP